MAEGNDSTAKPAQTSSCMVCLADLKEATILPCTHLVCSNCVMYTVRKKGKKCKSGKPKCPLCQSSIQADAKDLDDIDTFVKNEDRGVPQAAEANVAQSLSCPVCHEDFKMPKILPCTHLLCRKCVVSTLKKKRRSGKSECPLCQSPITKTDTKDLDDFETFVDELPTDHVTRVKVECQKTLNDKGVCTICDNDSVVESFCFQCDTKLCSSCAKVHSKLPFSSAHTIEKLSSLTPEQLAAKKCFPCTDCISHKEKPAEFYCSVHEDLLCGSCVSSSHRKCDDIEDITGAAEKKREDLEEQRKRLADKAASLSAEIQDCNQQVTEAETRFGEMRNKVIKVFSDLIKSLEDQKQKLLAEIREKQQIYLDEKHENKRELEAVKSSSDAHVNSIDTLLSSRSDQALLATCVALKPRLDEMESEEADTDDSATIGDVYFDDRLLEELKRLATLTGEVRDSPPEQDKQGLVHCVACNAISVREGTFQFVIEKPDRDSSPTSLKSQPCYIRNMPWKIDVQLWCEGGEFLGLFLENAVSSQSELWSCKAKADLRLPRVGISDRPFQRSVGQTFHYQNPAWGYREFIAMTDLLDPSKGYLKDDKLTFEAHVVPEAPEDTS